MAPIAPAAVEFHIHQVVPTFQMNMVSNANRKNLILFSWQESFNNGTHAIKIKGVNGDTGQAAINNKAEEMLNKNGLIVPFLKGSTGVIKK